jgi:hypothetical protein
MNIHPLATLRSYDLVQDAHFAATTYSEKYGDVYHVVRTGLGFAAVRDADMNDLDIEPWQIVGSPVDRRKHRDLNAQLIAATSAPEAVAS